MSKEYTPDQLQDFKALTEELMTQQTQRLDAARAARTSKSSLSSQFRDWLTRHPSRAGNEPELELEPLINEGKKDA